MYRMILIYLFRVEIECTTNMSRIFIYKNTSKIFRSNGMATRSCLLSSVGDLPYFSMDLIGFRIPLAS